MSGRAGAVEDEKTYDFYVMLKSDLMKGWPLPASVAHL
jgi:hypothetical protein